MRVRRRVGSAVVAGLVAAGGLGVAASSASAAAPRSSGYVPYIDGVATPKVNGLRIRSGPSTGALAEGLLYRGDRMRVRAEVRRPSSGSWFRVDLTRRSASGLHRGFSGWVYAPYLRHAR
jgi:Bacterial SH3 domain